MRKDKKNNTGEENTGDRNSGDWNSGYRNSGDRNSGDANSGDANSGYWNSGIYNTNEPKMRAFNKETDLTYTEFGNEFGYQDIYLPLNIWIPQSEMTDQEKKDHPFYETTEGYLRTLSYKEAWKEGWAKATQKQKDWYKSLPNFNPEIFYEITGIDIRESEKMIDIGGRKVSEQTILEALRKHFN